MSAATRSSRARSRSSSRREISACANDSYVSSASAGPRHKPSALSSAPRANVELILGLLGIERYLSAVATAEDTTRGKPDPEVYLIAARGLGVTPARCLVFEDAVVGVQAARSAGMRAIGVSTAHTETELRAAGAERAVEDFEEVSWPA